MTATLRHRNVVQVGSKYYNLDDPCDNCGHAFPCNADGSTQIGGYVQISSQFLRYCPLCDSQQPWPLKADKQPCLHKVDHDRT